MTDKTFSSHGSPFTYGQPFSHADALRVIDEPATPSCTKRAMKGAAGVYYSFASLPDQEIPIFVSGPDDTPAKMTERALAELVLRMIAAAAVAAE